jgi:hypothetical protein
MHTSGTSQQYKTATVKHIHHCNSWFQRNKIYSTTLQKIGLFHRDNFKSQEHKTVAFW